MESTSKLAALKILKMWNVLECVLTCYENIRLAGVGGGVGECFTFFYFQYIEFNRMFSIFRLDEYFIRPESRVLVRKKETSGETLTTLVHSHVR